MKRKWRGNGEGKWQEDTARENGKRTRREESGERTRQEETMVENRRIESTMKKNGAQNREKKSFHAGRATSLRMGKTRVEKLARESGLLIGPSVTSYRPISAEKNEATVENGSTNGDDSWNANSLYIKMASTRPDNAEEGEAEEEEEEERGGAKELAMGVGWMKWKVKGK